MSTNSDSTERGCSLTSGRMLDWLTISIQETFPLVSAIVHKCLCIAEFDQNVIPYDMKEQKATELTVYVCVCVYKVFMIVSFVNLLTTS